MQPTETQIYLITVEQGPAKIEGKLKTHFKVKIKDRVKIEEKKVTGEVVWPGAKHLIAEARMGIGTAAELSGVMPSGSDIA